MNKCDRPTRSPIDLLDELENVLGLQSSPVIWPLGNGPTFKGVFDRRTREVHLFERVPGGKFQAPVSVSSLEDPAVREKMDDYTYEQVKEQLAMLDGAGHPFDLKAVQAGQQTPVYFGSAVNNFGIQLLARRFPEGLRATLRRASPSASLRAGPRPADGRARGKPPVTDPKFSGFIFKIQANMDAKLPGDRASHSFVVCSRGKFDRDMVVTHQRTGKSVRLSSSHKLFGRERETVDEAWPGDVIGLVGHSEFGIGDTLTQDRSICYDEIPRFPSEVFSYISNPNTGDSKKYRAGLEQLLQEGVVQSFTARSAPSGATLLAAVGPLQFEVVQWRLQSEYNAESRLTPTPWTVLRWLEIPASMQTPNKGFDYSEAHRRHGRQLRRRQVREPRRAFPQRMDDALLPRKKSLSWKLHGAALGANESLTNLRLASERI